MNTQITIYASSIELAKSRIADLAKKAEKLNVEQPTITFGEPFIKQIIIDGQQFDTLLVNATITGSAPKLNGWTFAGSLENINGSVIVRAVPGTDVPNYFNNVDPCNCDHCKINRYRKNTYIVKNEAGEFKQVGGSCLKDFMGHATPENAVKFMEHSLQTIDEMTDSEFGGSAKPVFRTSYIAALSAAIIKKYGFYNSSSEYSTKERVIAHLFSNKQEGLQVSAEEIIEEIGVSVVDFMKNITGDDSFQHNLRVYGNQEYVDVKAVGFIAAAVKSYMKTEADKVVGPFVDINEEAIAADGTKISVDCKVISSVAFQRQSYHYYDSGISKILIMKTSDNKIIKMFSTNTEIEAGDTVNVSGKIGEMVVEDYQHSKMNGRRYTKMAPRARIKIVQKADN